MSDWDDEQREADRLMAGRRSNAPEDAGHTHGYLYRTDRKSYPPPPPTPCRVDYLKEIAILDAKGECSLPLRTRCIQRFGELPRTSPLHVSRNCPCPTCRGKWEAMKASVAASCAKRP